MSRIEIETAVAVNAAWVMTVVDENGAVQPCEAYALDASGNYLSGDGDDITAHIASGGIYITYEAFVSHQIAQERAARETAQWAENAKRFDWPGSAIYEARPLPAGCLFHRPHDEALCIVTA